MYRLPAIGVGADGTRTVKEPFSSSSTMRSDLIQDARRGLEALQRPDGHWVFELEADATIPADYVFLEHFLDEIDPALEDKIAAYLRAGQAEHGGWSLYLGGDFDLSASVRAYVALKLVGDDPAAPHGRDGAARPRLQSHPRHEHRGQLVAARSDQDLRSGRRRVRSSASDGTAHRAFIAAPLSGNRNPRSSLRHHRRPARPTPSPRVSTRPEAVIR
jgi:Squalene-hopene cyclase N-terminal domain